MPPYSNSDYANFQHAAKNPKEKRVVVGGQLARGGSLTPSAKRVPLAFLHKSPAGLSECDKAVSDHLFAAPDFREEKET